METSCCFANADSKGKLWNFEMIAGFWSKFPFQYPEHDDSVSRTIYFFLFKLFPFTGHHSLLPSLVPSHLCITYFNISQPSFTKLTISAAVLAQKSINHISHVADYSHNFWLLQVFYREFVNLIPTGFDTSAQSNAVIN